MHPDVFTPILKQYQDDLFKFVGEYPELLNHYASYLNHLWATNARYNLVSRRIAPETLVFDHLFDCLLGLPHLPGANRIADLGSGGGFPAAVLAIARPETSVHCFEKSPVKCQFLQSLGLKNLHVAGPIPNGQWLGESFDWITARAFKPVPVILELTRKHFRAGTPYWLYKGRLAKIEEELREARVKRDQARLVKLEPLGTPSERYLVGLNLT
jgi:16S rRNA (guanine527-N7)-methyltransferase